MLFKTESKKELFREEQREKKREDSLKKSHHFSKFTEC